MSADNLMKVRLARRGLVLTAAMLSLAGVTAPAQQAVRLGELYDQIRASSSRVEAGRALARAAQSRVRSARLPEDPQLQFGLMNRSLSGFDAMPGIGMTQVSLMQMIPMGGQLRSRRDFQRFKAQAADARAGETEWEVRTAVAVAFYDLYALEAQLTASRETLGLLYGFATTAEAMYRVGGGRQADVLRAQVEIARMSADTIRIHVARESVQARLAALLDRVRLSAGPPALPAFPDALPERELLQERALASRRELLAASSEIDAADEMQRLARRELWPDLAAGLAYSQGPGFGVMDEGAGSERMVSVMLGARLPVFGRARQRAMSQESAAMAQMARADLRTMAAETRAQVAIAHADLERARQLQVLYRSSILPQAQAAVESSLSAYRVGSVDFMALVESRITVNEYLAQLAMLQAEEGKAWAELEMLIAAPLFDPDTVAGRALAGGER